MIDITLGDDQLAALLTQELVDRIDSPLPGERLFELEIRYPKLSYTQPARGDVYAIRGEMAPEAFEHIKHNTGATTPYIIRAIAWIEHEDPPTPGVHGKFWHRLLGHYQLMAAPDFVKAMISLEPAHPDKSHDQIVRACLGVATRADASPNKLRSWLRQIGVSPTSIVFQLINQAEKDTGGGK